MLMRRHTRMMALLPNILLRCLLMLMLVPPGTLHPGQSDSFGYKVTEQNSHFEISPSTPILTAKVVSGSSKRNLTPLRLPVPIPRDTLAETVSLPLGEIRIVDDSEGGSCAIRPKGRSYRRERHSRRSGSRSNKERYRSRSPRRDVTPRQRPNTAPSKPNPTKPVGREGGLPTFANIAQLRDYIQQAVKAKR